MRFVCKEEKKRIGTWNLLTLLKNKQKILNYSFAFWIIYILYIYMYVCTFFRWLGCRLCTKISVVIKKMPLRCLCCCKNRQQNDTKINNVWYITYIYYTLFTCINLYNIYKTIFYHHTPHILEKKPNQSTKQKIFITWK